MKMPPVRRISIIVGRFIQSFLNLGLLKKLIICYVFLIIIPLAGAYALFDRLLYKTNVEYFDLIQKNALEQVKGNLNVMATQIEYVYNLLQYNMDLIDIMDGYYRDNSAEKFVYQNRLNELFLYVKNSNENISSLTVYKNTPQILSPGRDIIGMEMGLMEIYNSVKDGNGVWRVSLNDPGIAFLKYYKRIYNADFSRDIGLLEISVRCERLLSVLQAAESEWTNIYVYASESDKLLAKNESFALRDDYLNSFKPDIENAAGALQANETDLVVNGFRHESFGIYVLTITDVKKVAAISNSDGMVAMVMLPLVAALTCTFFFIFSSVVKLVRNFAQHIKAGGSGGGDNPVIFTGKAHRDEIGILIDSYNQMVMRINDLMTNVHKAQLQQKEAEFLALQSQINPHFMHNTLESVRMMAEIGESKKVAEMIQNLGALMRYSLSKNNSPVFLQDELNYTVNYLDLYRIRMGDRLTYTIEIDDGAARDISVIPCPKFILQPLVENCIIHGTSKLRRRGDIRINVGESRGDGYITIKISDNGAGILPEVLDGLRGKLMSRADDDTRKESYNGIGITNVNARIIAYYGGNTSLKIDSVLNVGTTYTINLYLGMQWGVGEGNEGNDY